MIHDYFTFMVDESKAFQTSVESEIADAVAQDDLSEAMDYIWAQDVTVINEKFCINVTPIIALIDCTRITYDLAIIDGQAFVTASTNTVFDDKWVSNLGAQ